MTASSNPPGSANGLIGRERELRELTVGIVDVTAGTGGLFLVHGEPGIGKSRLVEAAAEVAERNGVVVHCGRCWEVGGAPAYWPWIQILRSVVEDFVASDLAAVPGASALGQMVPELIDFLPERGPLAELEPEQASFQLMDAVAGVLRAATRKGPVAVVIEDLHAADPASITLLDFLARQVRSVPLLLIGTYRGAEAHREGVGEALARISREAWTSVHLGALTEDGVSECVVRATGIEPGPRVASAIHEASEGNPLFVVEIAGLMAEQGQLDAAGDQIEIAIPDSIRAVIRERASGLDLAAVELLQSASVLGREFQVSDLAELLEVGLSEVEVPLADVLAAKIVEDLGGGRYRFAHILICEAFYSGLFLERRRILHGRWAEKIENRHARDDRKPWTELAHHLFSAGPEVAPRAIEACVRAAEQARQQLAFDDAAEFLGRAVSLVDRSGEADPGHCCGMLLDHAQALLRMGRIDAGRQVCLEAASEARRLGNAELLARAALVYGSVFMYGDVDDILVDLLQEALGALDEIDSPERARLQARLAAASQPSEEPEEAFRIARDAIAMARRIDDRAVLLDTIRSGCSALMDLADPAERLALNREHVTLAAELGQPFDAFRGHMRIVIDAIELGDVVSADQAIEACARLSRETQLPHHKWPVACFRALRASMSGSFEDAAEWMEEAGRESDRIQDPNAARSIALQQLGFFRAQESFDDMVALQRQLQKVFAESDFTALFVWLLCGSDFARMGRSERIPAGIVDRGAQVALTYADPSLQCLVSEVAAATGSLEAAERLWDRLQPKRDHWVSWGLFGMMAEGPVSRILALLATSLGRAGQAERHFEKALDQARELGAWPMVARTAYEYAEHLLRLGDADRSDRVTELLREAEEIADRLGQSGLLELIGLSVEKAVIGQADNAGVPSVDYFSLVREGEMWLCSCEGDTFRLKDTKGVRLLARLTAEPGRGIHVLDLSGAAPAEGAAAERARVNVQRRLRDAVKRIAKQCPAAGKHLEWALKTGMYCSYDPRNS